MKSTRHNTTTSAALFLFGLGLIVSGSLMQGINSAQAQFFPNPGTPFANQMCIPTDPDISCGVCFDGLNGCINVIPDYLSQGFCESTSGSQGSTCTSGFFKCGSAVDCITREELDMVLCDWIPGMCG